MHALAAKTLKMDTAPIHQLHVFFTSVKEFSFEIRPTQVLILRKKKFEALYAPVHPMAHWIKLMPKRDMTRL